MRKFVVPVAVAGLLVLGLTSCSASTAATCERPSSADQDALELIDVTGEAGEKPTVEAFTPISGDTTQWEDVITGSGERLVSDSQPLALEVTLVDGTTGEELAATAYGEQPSTVATLAEWTQGLPGLATALEGACEGTRVAAYIAPEDLEVADGIDSIVAVADLRKVYLPKADGADQFVSGHGMPTVVRAPDGRPGIIVPNAPAPSQTQVEVLKRGEGEKVTGDVPVRVAYTGVTWADSTVFDSTWERGAPTALSLDGVVPGFAEALRDQTVGSQVLVVVTPEDGYGDQASGAIPAGSTLVFVIDIVGLDEPAPQ